MKPEYQIWITDYLARNTSVYGKCKEVSAKMQKAFPELVIVPGYVDTMWGRRDHFWLVDPTGQVVDPTESQFPGGVFAYEAWRPGSLTRVGKCMECGDEIWRPMDTLKAVNVSTCSSECEEALLASLNG